MFESEDETRVRDALDTVCVQISWLGGPSILTHTAYLFCANFPGELDGIRHSNGQSPSISHGVRGFSQIDLPIFSWVFSIAMFDHQKIWWLSRTAAPPADTHPLSPSPGLQDFLRVAAISDFFASMGGLVELVHEIWGHIGTELHRCTTQLGYISSYIIRFLLYYICLTFEDNTEF